MNNDSLNMNLLDYIKYESVFDTDSSEGGRYDVLLDAKSYLNSFKIYHPEFILLRTSDESKFINGDIDQLDLLKFDNANIIKITKTIYKINKKISDYNFKIRPQDNQIILYIKYIK